MMTRSLGNYIKHLREAAGYSQRQLAAQAGLHHSYLARLENGDNDSPTPSILQRLADVLEIDAAELLKFIGVKPSLPEPRTYFRRKFGVNAQEADVLARLIEEHQSQQQKKGGTS